MVEESSNGNGLVRTLFSMADEVDPSGDLAAAVARLLQQADDEPLAEVMTRLAKAAQMLRDAGAVSGAHAHFLIAHAITGVVEGRLFSGHSPALEHISKQIQDVDEQFRLAKGKDWYNADMPPEIRALSDEFDRVWDEVTAATFEEFGEVEMGSMFRHHRARYDALYEEGRAMVHGQKAGHLPVDDDD